MSRLKHVLLAQMPRWVQDHVILRQLHHAASAMPEVTVKVAESAAEHDAAARLTFEAYAARRLVATNGVPIRVTPFLMLPTTLRFVAIVGNEVIATLALFQDSSLGLPMSSIFSSELAQLRTQGRRLVEIGALAIQKQHRRSGLAMLMYKALWRVASQALHIDDIVGAIHPSAVPMYASSLRFVRLSERIQCYAGLQSEAVAQAVRIDLTTMQTVWKQAFSKRGRHTFNPYRFFYETNHPQIQVPTEPEALNRVRWAQRQAALRLASLRPEMLMSMHQREFDLLQQELALAATAA